MHGPFRRESLGVCKHAYEQLIQQPVLSYRHGPNKRAMSAAVIPLAVSAPDLAAKSSAQSLYQPCNAFCTADTAAALSRPQAAPALGQDHQLGHIGAVAAPASTGKQYKRQKSRNWTMTHSRLLSALRQRSTLLPKGSRVLVAVSGGQDSMALLRLLLDLQHLWPLHLAVAHCDHRMRPDSAANADFVRQQTQQLAQHYSMLVPCFTRSADILLSSEAAARSWRHQALKCMAEQAECSIILLGHTATDRAETLLLNMIRGSGLAGLSSMSWSRKASSSLTLVRPLLELTREDTAKVCRLTNTQIWEDSTNCELRYARNRLRLSVFPHLLAINGKAVQHIAQLSELVAADVELLEFINSSLLRRAVVPVTMVSAPAAAVAVVAASKTGSLSAVPDPVKTQQIAANETALSTNGTTAVRQRLAAACEAVTAAQVHIADNVAPAKSWSTHAPATIADVAMQCVVDNIGTGPSNEWQSVTGPSTASQPVYSPQEDNKQAAGAVSSTGQGLQVQQVQKLPNALQFRALKAWLEQACPRAVGYSMLSQVVRLLELGQGNGSRTSTLWGNTCVIRHSGVLLVVDAATAEQLQLGQLKLLMHRTMPAFAPQQLGPAGLHGSC